MARSANAVLYSYTYIYLYDHPAGDKEVVGGGWGEWLTTTTVMNVMLMVDGDVDDVASDEQP